MAMRAFFWSVVLSCVLSLSAGAQPALLTAANPPGESSGLTTVGFGENVPYSVSADGRWVAYASEGVNVVPGQIDTNEATDVFLLDRMTGARVLVSGALASTTTTGGGDSDEPKISPNGRYVVYRSVSTDLDPTAPTDTNSQGDVFLFDRLTGVSTLVSRTNVGTAAGNAQSFPRAVSDNGDVCLVSSATDLALSDSNGFQSDVFLYEGSFPLRLVSGFNATNTANGNSDRCTLSEDGNWLVFVTTATNVLSGITDTNFQNDLYLFELATGFKTLISHDPASTSTAAAGAFSGDFADLSSDGAWVVYSHTGALSATDANGLVDVYAWERATNTNTAISHLPGSSATGNGASDRARIGADGDNACFESEATDLISGGTDTNGRPDVFSWERATGTVTLASHASSSPTTAADNESRSCSISGDGQEVLFESLASDLVSGTRGAGALALEESVFLFDEAGGNVTLVSAAAIDGARVIGESLSALVSTDGSTVIYASEANDLVAATIIDQATGDDLFAYDVLAGVNELVSAADPGSLSQTASVEGGGEASDLGRYVVFTSKSSNLATGVRDDNNVNDIYRWDRVTDQTVLVSHRADDPLRSGRGASSSPALDASGRYVAFASRSPNLAAGQDDPSDNEDVFLWDGQTGEITLVSHATGDPLQAGNNPSFAPHLSSDGRWIAFESLATDLVPGQSDVNNETDTFLYEVATGTITLASGIAGSPTTTGDARSASPAISADGTYVVFSSTATDLLGLRGGGGGGPEQVYLFDRLQGTLTLVSHAFGSPTTPGNRATSSQAWISADGELVAFLSRADDLVDGFSDGSNSRDAFVWRRSNDSMTPISVEASAPTNLSGTASSVQMSAAGLVAFESSGEHVSGQTRHRGGFSRNIFLYNPQTGIHTLASHVPLSLTETTEGDCDLEGGLTVESPGPASVVFSCDWTDLSSATDTNETKDVFLWSAATSSVTLLSTPDGGATAANGRSDGGFSSPEGELTVFVSQSTDLIAGDFNRDRDLYWTAQQTLTELTLAVIATPDLPPPETNYVYDLTVTNVGIADVTGVVLDVDLPDAVGFVTADAPCVLGGALDVTCPFGTVPAESMVSVQIEVSVPLLVPSTLDLSANVGGNELDAEPSNNTVDYRVFVNDGNFIFADGFESGDLSAWQ